MIASMIAKRMVRSDYEKYNKDDFDVDAVLAGKADDIVYESSTECPHGTLKGKKAVADAFQQWKKEFPKRKFVVKNICFSAWPFCPKNVLMVEYSITETSKDGKEFKYDGASVFHMKNFKVFHGTDYISFAGLPPFSTIVKPTGKA
jgi:ketosteroid isomerase-like protein